MNPLRRSFVLLLACAGLACSSEPSSSGTEQREPSSGTKSNEPEAGKPEAGKPEAGKPEVGKPDAPIATALPAIELRGEAKECAPLAALPADASEAVRALVPVAEALRSIACTPAIFGQTTAEARATLKLPDTLPIELGRRYARITLGEQPVPVRDLLAVLGVADAKQKLRKGMVSWWVVELRPWGVGVVELRLSGDRHEERPNGTELAIPDDAAVLEVVVVMSEEVLGFADDPHAAAALAAALTQLAEQPDLLNQSPEDAAVALASLGERFELDRYSEGLGDDQVRGFSLRPNRTELVAADFAAALGLTDAAAETQRIYDANPHRLVSGGTTPFTWKGLELTVELDEREHGLGLMGWSIDDIQVLPSR